MALCEIGNHESDEVFTCSVCGADFCAEHGDEEAEICSDCLKEQEDKEEE